MRLAIPFLSAVLFGLAACGAPPNVQSANDYDAPAAPPVKHPKYDPYAAYGSANATWNAPVFNRDGSIVKPADPSVDAGRPDYEHSQWATGAAGGSADAPPGTF